MSILAIAPKVPKSRKLPEPARVPKFWQCPECIYRIPRDFPGGIEEPIAAHRNGHRLAAMGIQPRITWAILRPGPPRR